MFCFRVDIEQKNDDGGGGMFDRWMLDIFSVQFAMRKLIVLACNAMARIIVWPMGKYGPIKWNFPHTQCVFHMKIKKKVLIWDPNKTCSLIQHTPISHVPLISKKKTLTPTHRLPALALSGFKQLQLLSRYFMFCLLAIYCAFLSISPLLSWKTWHRLLPSRNNL